MRGREIRRTEIIPRDARAAAGFYFHLKLLRREADKGLCNNGAFDLRNVVVTEEQRIVTDRTVTVQTLRGDPMDARTLQFLFKSGDAALEVAAEDRQRPSGGTSKAANKDKKHERHRGHRPRVGKRTADRLQCLGSYRSRLADRGARSGDETRHLRARVSGGRLQVLLQGSLVIPGKRVVLELLEGRLDPLHFSFPREPGKKRFETCLPVGRALLPRKDFAEFCYRCRQSGESSHGVCCCVCFLEMSLRLMTKDSHEYSGNSPF